MTAVAERFWDKVATIPEHACWEWMASKCHFGHGQFTVGGKPVKAHRFAYEMHNGPIPDGLCACHKCDNPGCVNPAHIFLGTHTDNMADRKNKGRQPKGERHGRAKLTADQVVEIRAAYAAGGVSQLKLAKRLGVARSLIGHVVRGEIWKDG